MYDTNTEFIEENITKNFLNKRIIIREIEKGT